MTEKIFRNEPDYPIHVVPQCWQVFNEKYQMERGLFFLDGHKWLEMRQKLNPIFLKSSGIQTAHQNSKIITDKLIENLMDKLDNKSHLDLDLEPLLHKWSVESTLASLFGNETQEISNDFIDSVHCMFQSSASLQTQSALGSIHKPCGQQENDLKIGHSKMTIKWSERCRNWSKNESTLLKFVSL